MIGLSLREWGREWRLSRERSLFAGQETVVAKVVRVFGGAGRPDNRADYVDAATRETWQLPLERAPRALLGRLAKCPSPTARAQRCLQRQAPKTDHSERPRRRSHPDRNLQVGLRPAKQHQDTLRLRLARLQRELASTAMRGARYGFPGWAVETTTKGGKLKVD